MADDLISRQAVKDAFHAYMARRFDKDRCADAENCETCEGKCLWHEVVASVPAVDAVEVVHGRWEKKDGLYSCSECGKVCPYDARADIIEYWTCNFCPNCGADMRGNNNGC